MVTKKKSNTNFRLSYTQATIFIKKYTTKLDQTNNNNNNFYIFTLSIPTKNRVKLGFWSAIYSTIHIENYNLEKNNLIKRMEAIELKNIIIVTISDRFVEDAAKLTFKDPYSPILITFIEFKISKFFSVYTLNSFFDEYKERNFEIVYIIENLSWSEVCAKFLSVYIEISGGSNNKKHLLSSHQFRLSLLSYCLLGIPVYSFITKSFNEIRDDKDKKMISYNTEEVKNFIIDFKSKKRALANDKINSVSDEKKDHSENIETSNNKTKEIIDKLNLDKLPKKKIIIYKNKLFGSFGEEVPGIKRKYHSRVAAAIRLYSVESQKKKRFYSYQQKNFFSTLNNNNINDNLNDRNFYFWN